MEIFSESKSSEAANPSRLIPIPQLSPELEDADRYSVQAVVTLVWPFSNSNRSFSLLLAEPDFRLRQQNGQVRVTFRGSCAAEVARTKVGIGDTVTLSLQGALWTENKTTQLTPGKSVRWELQFEARVKLQATRNGKETAAIDFKQQASSQQSVVDAVPTTPTLLPRRIPSPILSQERWDTPAFLRSKRLHSQSPVRSNYDIFAEEDGFIFGIGRKRPRFSFPSNQWRLVDEFDSTTPDMDEHEGFRLSDSEEELMRRSSDAKEGQNMDTDTRILRQKQSEIGPDVLYATSDAPEQSSNGPENIAEHEHGDFSPSQEDIAGAGSLDTEFRPSTPQPIDASSSNLLSSSPLDHTRVKSTHELDLANDNASISQQLDDHLENPAMYSTIPLHENYSADSGEELLDRFAARFQSVNSRSESIIQPAGLVHNGANLFTDGDENSEAYEHNQYDGHTSTGLANEDDETNSTALNVFNSQFEAGAEFTGPNSLQDTLNEPMHDESEGTHGSSIRSRNDDANNAQMAFEEPSELASPGQIHDDIMSSGSDEDQSQGGESDVYDERDVENGHSPYSTKDSDEESISEEFEETYSEADYEEETADEICTEPARSKSSPRIVHHEVIVLDSDSEDEQQAVHMSTTVHVADSNLTAKRVSDPDESNFGEDSDISIKDEEEKGDFRDYEQEDETNSLEDNDSIERASLEDEDTERDHIRDEYSINDTFQLQDDEDGENLKYGKNIDEGLFKRNNSRDGRSQAEGRRSGSPLSAIGSPSSILEDTVMGEDDNPLQPIDSSREGKHHNLEVQSPNLEGQNIAQEQPTGRQSMQRLAFRTVSPMPRPDSASPGLPKQQRSNVEHRISNPAGQSSSPSPEIIESEVVREGSRHRWLDGSNEYAMQDPSRQSSNIEHEADLTANGIDDASEKFDEVVLVNGSVQSSEDVSRLADFERMDDSQENEKSALITPGATIPSTLAMLRSSLDQTANVIAIVVDIVPIDSSDVGDDLHGVRLRVTDISLAGTTVAVNIVQPVTKDLPDVAEGEPILLRAFKITMNDGSIELKNSFDSEWAAFNSVEQTRGNISNLALSNSETNYIDLLQDWFHEEGATMAAEHMLQLSISQEQEQSPIASPVRSDTGSVNSRKSGPVSRPRVKRRKSHRRVTIHELRDGRRYTEFGWLDNDSIHELRDGTVYVHPFERDG